MIADTVRLLVDHEGPCAVAGCRERGQGGPAGAYAGSEESGVFAAGCVAAVLVHWDTLGLPLVVVEDSRSAAGLAV